MQKLQNASAPKSPPLPANSELPWALFLDLDGTLLEIAEHPDAVHVPAALVPLLDELQDLLGGAVAVVSGRQMVTLHKLLPQCRIDLAGCHGAQLRLNGQYVDTPAPPSLAEIAARLMAFAGPVRGALVEVKSYGVALHYRSTSFSPSDARMIVDEMIRDVASDFRVIAGKAVVEVVPKWVGKHFCIEWLMKQTTYLSRRPVFIGDDTTDEDAFELVNSLGGYSVFVGSASQTHARYQINGVSDVLQWLAGPLRASLLLAAPTLQHRRPRTA